ncbi:MAG: DUF1801 domain-containing protein [Bacteroidota bacterium]
MKQLQVNSDPKVKAVFDQYPAVARKKMNQLRTLVLETARELAEVETLEETLKWGEPSYISRHGSTLRMDWKAKKPNQYAMYFSCSSQLVPTFRLLYPQLFEYEGKRAIVFSMDAEVPHLELKRCIAAALMYHKVKQLPMLGM